MLASRTYALGVLIFTLSWLAYDHYRPWVNFHSEMLALIGAGLLALGLCASGTIRRSATPRISAWVCLMGVLPWIQYLFGVGSFAGDAVIASLYIFGFGVVIWVGFKVAANAPNTTHSNEAVFNVTALYYSLWFAALASAAIGLLQWLNLQGALQMYALQTDAGDRAMGNLGQPNQLATLLLIGIASIGWTYETRRIGKPGLIAAISFLTLILVFTQSRAGMLSVAVMGAFLVWKNRGVTSRLGPLTLACWMLAYFAALMLLPTLFEVLLLGGNRSMNPGSDAARITIWKQVIYGIAQSPWFGYGWNGTPAAHAAGSLAVPGSLTYTNAHNVILDIVAWNGVPLGLLMTVLGGYWFVSRVWRTQTTNAIYAMAALIPIAVHSMVEYPFAYSYFLLTAGLMIGIVEASHPRAPTFRFNSAWLGSLLIGWFAIGGFIIYEYLLVEEDFRIVRFENLKIGTTQADYEIPEIRLLSQMGAMLTAARQKPVPNMSAEELTNLQQASQRFAYGSLAFRNAIALGLNGNPEGASHQMAIIKGMYGDYYYRAAISVLRDMERENYPQLSKVLTP